LRYGIINVHKGAVQTPLVAAGPTGARSADDTRFIIIHDKDKNISTIFTLGEDIRYFNTASSATQGGLLTLGRKLLINADGKEMITGFKEHDLLAALGSGPVIALFFAFVIIAVAAIVIWKRKRRKSQ